jgi:hypothetical protein
MNATIAAQAAGPSSPNPYGLTPAGQAASQGLYPQYGQLAPSGPAPAETEFARASRMFAYGSQAGQEDARRYQAATAAGAATPPPAALRALPSGVSPDSYLAFAWNAGQRTGWLIITGQGSFAASYGSPSR